ncbi:MAG: FadR/GntR family transcriptional regulator [Candidatus Fimousia sp.]|uniref:FadR/GntR family transcriptional regulator n=1 Tax=Anaerostipes sp. 992a TaxID=1261637 RepID=UPI0009FAEEFA|nr:FCD domain-containing protein [Anaerostipes sp. 992a]MDD5969684.1 FCD domain-containing protein [Anaerostipes sp.]
MKIINYVKREILAGALKPGDQLLPERELAEILGVSRNSVREGLRTLDNMGVIKSFHGSGNYIAGNFEETLTEVMTFMYMLKDMDYDHITEFRYALEWQAMNLAVRQATDQQRQKMQEYYKKLITADREETRVKYDKAIHYLLVQASKNDYMISNYKALNNIMDRYIPTMRGKIIEGMKSDERLINAHRRIVEGFVEGNYLKGRQGLNLHFRYIKEYKDYEEVHKNGME